MHMTRKSDVHLLLLIKKIKWVKPVNLQASEATYISIFAMLQDVGAASTTEVDLLQSKALLAVSYVMSA